MSEEKNDIQKSTPQERHAVREVKTYVDDKGREVIEFSQVFGKKKEPSFYKGRAVLQVRMQGPNPPPPRNQQFEFDIDATGVRRAFELFDEYAGMEIDRIREKQKERARISVPKNNGTLFGPDGNIVS